MDVLAVIGSVVAISAAALGGINWAMGRKIAELRLLLEHVIDDKQKTCHDGCNSRIEDIEENQRTMISQLPRNGELLHLNEKVNELCVGLARVMTKMGIG